MKELNHIAGLGFGAPSKKWVSANGFSTGKDNLDVLVGTAKTNNMDAAVEFLTDLKRLSAVSSYLSSFVEGIDTFTKSDGFLHVGLTQHITSTGTIFWTKPQHAKHAQGRHVSRKESVCVTLGGRLHL